MQWFARMLSLNEPVADVYQRPTARYISVTEQFREKISSIAPLDKIVLLSPTSISGRGLIRDDATAKMYWGKEAQLWTDRGYKVIVSNIEPLELPGGATWIDMSMEEAVWLGVHCHHVTTCRSGYTDLVAFLCKDITVVHMSYLQFVVDNFYDPFKLEINEIIVPGNEIRTAEGIPLSLASDIGNLHKLKRNYRLVRILSHITILRRKYWKERKRTLRSRIQEAQKAKETLYSNRDV